MNWGIILKSLGHSEMRTRIFAVLGMLLVFRILAHIPVPLSDPQTLRQVLDSLFSQGGSSNLLSFLNIVSGGALANFSIVLVGLIPYINASIIMQLLTRAIPRLEKMHKEEGEYGRKKINQYTRILTFPLAIVQSIGMVYLIRQAAQSLGGLGNITSGASLADWVLMISALTGGAMVLMWLGELITERSVGNGISLLITVGIVSGLPLLISQLSEVTTWRTSFAISDKLTLFNHDFSKRGLTIIGILIAVTFFIIWAVVKLNEASRKLTINYAKRVQGNRTYGGVTTTLPVKLITAGVIPIIFAVAFLSVPSFAGQILTQGQGVQAIADTQLERIGVTLSELFQNPSHGTFAVGGWKPWVYPLTYFFLVFIFTYFYTSVTFNSKEISENLQKQGGFIANVRSGSQTQKYLSKTVNRLTLFGATALGLLAVIPILGQVYVNQNIAVGGTSILILVSVSLETMRQIESRALMITYDQYEQPDYFYEDEPGAEAKKSKRSRLLRLIPNPRRQK
ncbi:preprotein translocase subunit SecY [Candidatus Saccharibacteria bacterium]|nr:preprotein translocase subunit SecY [Candidatus Saccharibacteria bacterium]